MPSIVISSGHGKYVRGAAGPPPWGLDEVNEARRVVERVATILDESDVGVTVFHDDTSQTQNQNLNTIVNFHNAQQRDLDVSVHFNCYDPTSKPMGVECLYVTQSNLAKKVSKAISNAGKLFDRGPKERTDLFFLNNTEEPSILIEVCFCDSQADVAAYNENFENICAAIAVELGGAPAEPVQPPLTELPPPAPMAYATIQQGDSGEDVARCQRCLGIEPDGEFGPITKAAVIGFQKSWGTKGGYDGVVGPNTWADLQVLQGRCLTGDNGITDQVAAHIDEAAQQVASVSWKERGKAPAGYYSGMGMVFALAIERYRNDDEAAKIMGREDMNDPAKDCLTWYREQFSALGMANTTAGLITLRHLFVLQIGLGMRESSGNHWVGVDASAGSSSMTADTCEAGLMQSSWNLRNCASCIQGLFNEYKANPNGFQVYFSRSVDPDKANLENYGDAASDGCYYQWLAKYAPAFTCLMSAVGMRKLGGSDGHWGPIRRHEAEIKIEIDNYLAEVQAIVDSYFASA